MPGLRRRVSRIVDPTDVAPAIRSLRQALVLDSTNAEAWHFLGLSLGRVRATWMARSRPGAAPSRRTRPTPRGWHSLASATTCVISMTARHAGRTARSLSSRITCWAGPRVGTSRSSRGDFARGRAAFEAARRLSTDVEVPNALAGSALAEARAGASREARSILQRADSLAARYEPAPLHTAVYLAHAYAALGDADHAIAWLRRYTPRNDLHFQQHLRCDPPFTPIQRDPRFRSLLLAPRPETPGGC